MLCLGWLVNRRRGLLPDRARAMPSGVTRQTNRWLPGRPGLTMMAWEEKVLDAGELPGLDVRLCPDLSLL